MRLRGGSRDVDYASSSQVRIQLSTRDDDISLPKNPGPLLVNTSNVIESSLLEFLLIFVLDLRRYALSTLVNHLLKTEKPIPFEFLINGTFLRTTLDEYLTSRGISSEATVPLEYVRAAIPPVYKTSFMHDNWVCSVDVLSVTSPAAKWVGNARIGFNQERVISGDYDGLLRVWDMTGDVLAVSRTVREGGPVSALKSVKFISPTQIASCGMDGVIRLWEYTEDAENLTASLSPQIELCGQRRVIESIAVHQPSSRILSASGDHTVGVWSTNASEAPSPPEELRPSHRGNKRQKVQPSTTPQCGPLALLESHTAQVADTIFAPNDHTVAYSVSWDHSLKTWDLPTSTCVDTRSTTAVLFATVSMPNLNLVAVGGTAGHITLFDPRDSTTTVSAMTLRGHKNFTFSLATDPDSAYRLVSGSADGTCRVWDIRSSTTDKNGKVGASVECLQRESGKREAKVFGVCWDKDVGILSASEDKFVQINGGAKLEARIPRGH